MLICLLCAAFSQTDVAPASPEFAVWDAGIYRRFRKEADAPELSAITPLSATACANETVLFQLAAFSTRGGQKLRVLPTELTNGKATLPVSAWKTCFADYVHTTEKGPLADILTEESERPMPSGVIQPIWLSLHILKGTPPGHYNGAVKVALGRRKPAVFPVNIHVLPATLQDPGKGTFYLDLWQHPATIARYHQIPLWSEDHWRLVRDYTKLLAGAGQNPITATIIHDPWASQTRDPHESLVDWRREKDGLFSYDFTNFDRYVDLCLSEGFTGPINCYSTSMGPGGRTDCPIRYWDAAQSGYGKLECQVGDAVYRDAWKQFFAAFIPHLEEKRWLDRTCIAVDEAPEEKMNALLSVIPEKMKIALAGNWHEHLSNRIHDYSIIYPGAPREANDARRKAGRITTFYTCCGPAFPNTFCSSPPVESRLLGWQALKQQADGYLRWAYASWGDDPLKTGDFGPWPSGDTFLVYPGPKSSLRFELLKQGIQDFEAWHLASMKSPEDPRLVEALQLANANHNGNEYDAANLDAARELVNRILADAKGVEEHTKP